MSNKEKRGQKYLLNAAQIKRILPHRYPFLLLDAILEMTPKKLIKGVKNVTVDEPFFQGHFPDEMIVPGALIIESLAQLTAVLYCLEDFSGVIENTTFKECDLSKKVGYLAAVDKFKLTDKVYPGDRMILVSELEEEYGNLLRQKVTALVDEKIVASGCLTVTKNT